MRNEQLQLSPPEVQRNLWGKLCGEQGIQKRLDQARRGHLPSGLSLAELYGEEERFAAVLGEFAPRVLIVSDPSNPLSLVPEQIAVAGGWCALRTKDVANLSQQGVIMDPQTGALQTVRNVDQVACWIQQSVTFDQIVESIGAPNASEYAVISEKRLWTERLVAKTGAIVGRKLNQKEQDALEQAVDISEKVRAEMTKRYLQIVTGNENIIFTRVVDEDIWKDLRLAQAEMLSYVGLSIAKLQAMFPKDAETIKTSAMVWAMYSQPYFQVLRDKGLLEKQTVFVVEPSLHTFADTAPGNEVVQRIYQEQARYFDPKGMNKDTGFIAFIECVTPEGLNVRKNLAVGEVPNIVNWPTLFMEGQALDPSMNAVVNPKDNKLFLWGVNLFPFGKVRERLLRLVTLQEEFQREKAGISQTFSANELKRNPEARISMQQKVGEIRQRIELAVADENQKIAKELQSLLSQLTRNLPIDI